MPPKTATTTKKKGTKRTKKYPDSIEFEFSRRKKMAKVAKAATFSRGPSRPLGNKSRQEHRYVEIYADLDPGVSGAAAFYRFSANGMYDPNITSTGHQPVGFDQIGLFFNHYTVIYSTIKVTFLNLESTYAQIAGIHMDDNTVTPGSNGEMIENGNTVYTVLGVKDSGNDIKTLTMDCNIGKFFGRPNILSEDDFRGNVAANPTEQVYWTLFAYPDTNTDTGVVRAHVEINYVAIWTEPKDIAAS